MDQLKLVLEHKFWILAGLVVLLPPIGWWAATDKIAKDTFDRNNKITAAERKIPEKPQEIPNEKWIKGAKEIAGELSVSVVQSEEQLFDHQKSEMKLLDIVQNALTKSKVKYRQDGGATPDFLVAKDFFVGKYLEDWKSAVNVIKPYKVNTGEGLVWIAEEQERETPAITRHLEVEQWQQTRVFTAAQMWDVQEDVWFLRSLMQAIARVNEGTTEIGNARIKRLNEATLRGGNQADLAARRKGTATSSTPTAATPARTGLQLGQIGSGYSRHGAGVGGPSYQPSYPPPKPFDPNDIFGDDGSQSEAPGYRKDAKDAVATEVSRWVEQGGNPATGKWYKRGFVLRLVMDEREIPSLLAELSQSAFPVEIRHVEHAVYSSTGAAAARLSSTVQSTTNADGSELTKEQVALQQKIAESLRLAFNMHYLADVIVAGTLTIYSEPPASASKNVAATQPAPSQAAAATSGKTGGSGDGKNALPGNRTAKSEEGAVSTPLAAPPGSRTQPAKAGGGAGAPASPRPSGNKTNPGSPKQAGTLKPVGSGSPSASK